MRRRKTILWLTLVLLGIVVSIGIAIFNAQNQEKITIAIAVPLTNVGDATQAAGKSMLQGVELYINKVNQAGGIQGKPLKLEVYDDQAKPEVAEKIAEEIVRSKAVAVIGHYSSSTSKAAGKIYQAAGIPAISGSATADSVTEGNDWYFRTVFADSFQGRFIAYYLKKVLGYSKIFLIHGYDAYGLGLGQTIEAEFRQLGGDIVAKWKLEENQNKATDEIIIKDLQKLKDSGQSTDVVVLAANRDQVTNLIVEIKRRNLDFPLFGGDDIGDVAIGESVANLPEEKESPGYFTNGLYATVPLIYDVADDRTQQFRTTFEQTYGTPPGWSAACYYDAISALVEAMDRTLLTKKDLPKKAFTGKDIKTDRYLVKDGLAGIDSPETAIQTGTRTFYLNEYRNAVVPIAVGLFDKGNLVSAFTQLQTISNIKKVADFDEQIARGDILQVGDRYLRKTDIVYVGIDINKVSYLDEKTSSYLVDSYLWFRYKTALDADNIEFINYGINRLDSGDKLKLGEPIKSGQEADVKYKVYRIKADFHEEFDFHDYPFDTQLLSVRFRHANLTRDKLIYAIDFVGMRDKSSTTKKLPKQWKEEVFKEISAWTPEKVTFYQDTLVNKSTLGDRRVIDTNSDLEYSQFNTVISIKRDLLGFSIKNLLPLWFFVVVAYLLLFLPFENLSAEVLSGLLLAVVFYHLSLLESLPDGVGYVVALDYAFYLVYLLLGLELLLVIVGHKERFQKDKIKLDRLIMFGRISFPAIILIFFGTFYSLYLR
ncbi:ABC transporter substrate-binding protein [Planktothrix sp. FACHB-1355]|uniref:ABC transporter substrate-binding protein n=1 Tax=Aerosakkonema funiforme FACHB-1375 TaxID=2949571 RepID=A0A926VAW3_9CYAN|nr:MULTISPECIES: ABC transporter substrate-binding protein [Oscillatoriales]MBD2180165.1 ABC transporter substrate-binding protein [Aerosakkonema funiforme FACHB-1375]MBD3559814.1 ABC transporter substrate-binding protein [Planktothrix sp. FACHB-1355]